MAVGFYTEKLLEYYTNNKQKKQSISYAFYLNNEQRNEPNTKNFRKHYKGKMTKRYFQILIRTSNSEVIDAYKVMLDRQIFKK